jgi:hypothetical protein
MERLPSYARNTQSHQLSLSSGQKKTPPNPENEWGQRLRFCCWGLVRLRSFDPLCYPTRPYAELPAKSLSVCMVRRLVASEK